VPFAIECHPHPGLFEHVFESSSLPGATATALHTVASQQKPAGTHSHDPAHAR